MTQIYLASYATRGFEKVRQELNASAERHGISRILSYNEADLHASDYYQRNRSILDEICGAGYWAWKPYFILEALDQMQEGDVLFYCDAGSMLVESPQPLIDLCAQSQSGLILFDSRPLQNRQFTKRRCFRRMGCDEERYWNAPMVIATLLVVRKCPFSLTFMREWQEHCCDRATITDDAEVGSGGELDGYLQHRHDQSILSLLSVKHSLETFRNPTVWGNFLKSPAFRVRGERVVSPYELIPDITSYASQPQANSPYGTIFVINRQPNTVGKTPLPLRPKNRSLVQRLLRKLKMADAGLPR